MSENENNNRRRVVVPDVANSRKVNIISRNDNNNITLQEQPAQQIHQPTANKDSSSRRTKSSLGNRNLRNRVVTRFNNNENQNREKNNIQSNTGTAQNTENIKIIREPNRKRIAPRRRPNSVLTTNKEKERYRIIRESIEATIKTFPEDMKETDIIHLWF